MVKDDPDQKKDRDDDFDGILSEANEVLRKFFPFVQNNGQTIAETLVMYSDSHYGFYQTIEAEESLEHPFEPSTSEAERAELAKTQYSGYGVTFASRDEVKKVAKLFEERFGDKVYDATDIPKELIEDLNNVLNEIRNEL